MYTKTGKKSKKTNEDGTTSHLYWAKPPPSGTVKTLFLY